MLINFNKYTIFLKNFLLRIVLMQQYLTLPKMELLFLTQHNPFPWRTFLLESSML